MRTFLSIAVSALALALCAACSEPAQNPEAKSDAQPTAAPLKVEPLAFTERTLANGLKVYAMRDENTANVSVQVWYDVGGKDDPIGRSGFAHLFEHIMFKATRNMPAENFDRLTEDVGGQNNASTADDYTNYYEEVPANHLERILWAEADRMSALVIDKKTFASERDVVKEEFRQRILAQPYGKLFGLYVSQANFTVHPYGRPTIGSIEDLDAATVEDVRAFHAAYYRPDNAILVISGNFDPATLDQWVDKYFAPIAKPSRPIPRVTAVEPARTAPREYTVYEPNVPLPAVAISYPTGNSLSPDLAALNVLDAILSKGESSRLYQSLVYTQQVATQAFSFFEPTRDPGTYTLGAVMSEGKSIDDGIKGLMAEIARVRDTTVTAAELDEAKNEILSESVQQRETALGRADELADSVIRYRDPKYADKLLAEMQAVTAADVQRVAKAILDDKKRVTIRYLGDDKKPADAKSDVIATAPTVEAHKVEIPAAEIPVYQLAPEATRVKPPAPGPAVAGKVPTTEEKRLANGLRVIVASKRGLPLLSAELRVLSGSSNDPETKAGVADLTADVLTKGTKTKSAGDIAREIETLGASISASAGADSSALSIETLSTRANDAFAIAADIVRNPVFANEELERQRQQTLDGLQVSMRQPGSVARYAMTKLLFGAGPYGGVSSPKSVAAIKAEDIRAFHQAHWRPDNALLVITGDVSAEDGFKLAEKYFGDWPKPPNPTGTDPDANMASDAKRAIMVDLPKAGQAAVVFGMRGVPRTGDDYFPTLVANTILGVGYSSRLNQEIRIKRGLSYGASSSFPARLARGPIVAAAQTRNDAAAQVVDLVQAELTKLGAAPAGEPEIASRKAVLIGGFGRDVETTSGLAGQLAQVAAFGLPLDKLQSYVSDVSAVTPDQAREAAAKLYDPKNANLVVVGDGTLIFNALKKKRPTLERIPIDQLNLDSPTLK